MNESRSSLSRQNVPSINSPRSTTTNPSQPVLLRIHSDHAHAHNNPAPRLARRPLKRDEESKLPALEEYSMRGILDAIFEDVENDIDEIAEILGRTRLVMADQHESHLPPQGEIRGATEDGRGVQQVGTVRDEVEITILNDEASLVDGSNSSSLAHRLLASLQAVSRSTQAQSSTDRDTAFYSHSRSGLSEASPKNVRESRVASGSTFTGAPALPVIGESHFVAAADISNVHHETEASGQGPCLSSSYARDAANDSTSARSNGVEVRLRSLLNR